MNKSYLLLIGMISLSACGNKPLETRSVDPALETYVESFENYLGGPIDYSVQFGVVPAGVAGECDGMGTEQLSVTVSSDYAMTATVDQMEQLIFHELGHCTLNRVHNPDINSDYEPESIMNPYAFTSYSAQYYHIHRAEYLKELFGR